MDIFDAIDEVAVHHCGHCDELLGPETPSRYWCDDICQAAFYARRSIESTTTGPEVITWNPPMAAEIDYMEFDGAALLVFRKGYSR